VEDTAITDGYAAGDAKEKRKAEKRGDCARPCSFRQVREPRATCSARLHEARKGSNEGIAKRYSSVYAEEITQLIKRLRGGRGSSSEEDARGAEAGGGSRDERWEKQGTGPGRGGRGRGRRSARNVARRVGRRTL